jgi:drug/metabolite transporter (DMT)-like permease
MDAVTFAVIMLAAISHASWNALLRAHNGVEILFGMTVLSGVVGIVGVLLLPPISSDAAIFLAIGAIFHIGSRLSSRLAYLHGDMSQVYPLLRGAIPVAVALLALLFVNEQIGLVKAGALIIIAIGTGMLAFRGGSSPSKLQRSVVVYSLITALCAAAYTLIDGLGVRVAGQALTFSFWIFLLEGIGGSVVIWLFNRRMDPHLLWKNAALGGVAGSLQLLSFGLAIYAMSRAPIAVVAAARESSLIFGLLISRFILQEPTSRWRVGGALLIVAALVVIQIAGSMA